MHRFDHEAMNTKLDLLICGADHKYALSAAAECFDKVDMLETLLSMYREGSDIDMINSSPVGSVVKLSCDACDCLVDAFAVSSITGGAIDVSLGDYYSKMKKGAPNNVELKRGKFEIDPENFYIKKVADGKIDLGCIGKGYAVDRMVEILRETWEIENAFISFGGSSIFAFGKPEDSDSWRVNLSKDISFDIPPSGMGVGASGVAVQGEHVFDGRTGEVPEHQPFRTWAFGNSAAFADAFSTAFMILGRSEVEKICAQTGMRAAFQETESSEPFFL